MSSKDKDEEPVMHSKCDSIEIMINDKTHGVIEKRFQSLIWRWYQIGLCRMKGSDLIFNCVHLSHYGCHKIIFKPSRSSIDFLDWKKATINPINKQDNKFFQQIIEPNNCS